MSPAEDARQRLAAGKLTLQEARAIIEEHLRIGLAKGSDEEKRRIAGLVNAWRHQSSSRSHAKHSTSEDESIRSSTWLEWLWAPDDSGSGDSGRRWRSTSASGKLQAVPSDHSGRGSLGRSSNGSGGNSSDADDSRLSDRLSGTRLSERASDLDPRVGIALVRYSDAIMAFNDAQATMSQGVARDRKAQQAREERLARTVALESAATSAAVAEVLEAIVAGVLTAGREVRRGAEDGEEAAVADLAATSNPREENLLAPSLSKARNETPTSPSKDSDEVPSTPPSTPAKGADDTKWYPGKHLGRLFRHLNGESTPENCAGKGTDASTSSSDNKSGGIVDSDRCSESSRGSNSNNDDSRNEVANADESTVAELRASLVTFNEAAALRATAWAQQVKELKEEVDRSFEALEALSSELHSSSGGENEYSTPPESTCSDT